MTTVQATDQCRSCRRPVIRAVTERGRRIDLDPTPRAGEELRLVDGDPCRALKVEYTMTLLDDDDGLRYRRHRCGDA